MTSFGEGIILEAAGKSALDYDEKSIGRLIGRAMLKAGQGLGRSGAGLGAAGARVSRAAPGIAARADRVAGRAGRHIREFGTGTARFGESLQRGFGPQSLTGRAGSAIQRGGQFVAQRPGAAVVAVGAGAGGAGALHQSAQNRRLRRQVYGQ